MSSLNFMSYNPTGLDKAKVAWINDLIETFKIDCLQLQEHFKAIKFEVNFKKSV